MKKKTPLEKIEKLIHKDGMTNILQALIDATKENIDVDYISILHNDLQSTLNRYKNRYHFEE